MFGPWVGSALSERVAPTQRGLHGLQFIVNTRFRHGIAKSWDSNDCRPFWDGVTALSKPIFFTIVPPCPGPTLEDYLEQLRLWRCWLERYPHVRAVLTHGFAFCWKSLTNSGTQSDARPPARRRVTR